MEWRWQWIPGESSDGGVSDVAVGEVEVEET